MTLDFTFFAIAVPAVILAGMSKGGFGSGAAFLATPLLALVLPPEMAVGIMLPVLMAIDAATLGPYWRRWSPVDARRLIVGALPGIALAALVWRWADPDLLKFLIGVIAIGFVVFRLCRARGVIGDIPAPGARAGMIAGAVSGFTSFISHAGGPPASIYLLARQLGKTEYQATTVLVFWAVNIFKTVPYAALGMFSQASLMAAFFLVPPALLGAWLGVLAHRHVPERLFFALTYVLLAGAGSRLIWDALT